MAKLIWGIDPLAVSRLGRTAKKPPFTKKELARIGIPAHKIPRVQEELARLTADKTLTREELGRLAEELPCRNNQFAGNNGKVRPHQSAGGAADSFSLGGSLFSQTALVPSRNLCYNKRIVPNSSGAVGKTLCVAASHAEGVT